MIGFDYGTSSWKRLIDSIHGLNFPPLILLLPNDCKRTVIQYRQLIAGNYPLSPISGLYTFRQNKTQGNEHNARILRLGRRTRIWSSVWGRYS